MAGGKWSDAVAEFDRAQEVLRVTPDIYEGLYGRDLDIPLALAMSGRAPEAVVRLQRGYEYRREYLPRKHPEIDESLGLLALARRRTGEVRQAMADFRTAVPGLIQQTSEGRAAALGAHQRRVRIVLEEYLDLLLEQGGSDSIDEAFRIADTAQGGSVQRALSASSARAAARDPVLADLVRREQDAGQKLEVLEARLAAYHNTRPTEQPGELISQTRAQVEQLRSAHATIKAEISRRFPAYASLMAPRPPSIAKVQAVLQPAEAVVVVWVGPTRSAVWVIPAVGPATLQVVPQGMDALSQQIRTLRHVVDAPITTLGDVPAFDIQLAYQLYRTLLAPVEPVWRAAKSLLIVPHGPLGQIPFGLLVTTPHEPAREQEGRALFSGYRTVPWLVRRVAVTQLPSVASLLVLRELSFPQVVRRPFVGFGDPWFNSRQAAMATAASPSPDDVRVASRGLLLARRSVLTVRELDRASLSLLPRLPETADEIRSIAAALGADPASDVFLGRAANEQVVTSIDLSNRRVVAFATHGLVPGDLDGLTEPALALTAPEVAGITGDGLLTMGKILGLRLNADWVVLSACNTAAADGAGAEAVSGLGRAFFYAGTRAVLVSNWPVESTAARELTTAVFQLQEKDPSLTRAEALRLAMLSLIDGPGRVNNGRSLFSYAHPLFWAPFSLVGDGGGGRLPDQERR